MHEFAYPSNLLGLVRLALLVPTLKNLEHPAQRWQALGYLCAAMLTDALDGKLARSRGEVSQLGKILDPVADKVLMNGVAIKLSQKRGFPWWMTRLLLLRDVAILLLGFYLYRRKEHIAMSLWAGKAFTMMLTGTLLMYIVEAEEHRSSRLLLFASLIFLTLSCVQYGHAFVRTMQDHQ
jgi:CDP-diacylglycerol--glycerol-3-phosphate 3-phosphatidyltransferase